MEHTCQKCGCISLLKMCPRCGAQMPMDAEIKALIEKGRQLSDEWCGPWCKPIHILIGERGKGQLTKDIVDCAQGMIHELVRTDKKAALTSRSPVTMAAASCYLSGYIIANKETQGKRGGQFARFCQIRKTQREIAHIFDLTETTVRNASHDLEIALAAR